MYVWLLVLLNFEALSQQNLHYILAYLTISYRYLVLSKRVDVFQAPLQMHCPKDYSTYAKSIWAQSIRNWYLLWELKVYYSKMP